MPVLDWVGREQVLHHDRDVPSRILKPIKSLSVENGASNGNLLIHGDNLEALKALMPFYYDSIKCVYIDPPYNTGQEKWKYNDRVNSPKMREWLGQVVGPEAVDLCRHDKWLCMMYPRLKLLHDLLRKDGIIFISIDENESYHLRLLMNTIFKPENFIAEFVWRGRSGKTGTISGVSFQHEYVLCYGRSSETRLKMEERTQVGGRNWRTDAKGRYRREQLRQWGQAIRREDRPSMFYPIKSPTGVDVYPILPDGKEGRWRVGRPKAAKLLAEEELDFEFDDKNWQVYRKMREGRTTYSAHGTILEKVGTTADGTKELKRIFRGEAPFDYPKPVSLVRRLLEIAGLGDDSENVIILDSFAGSGTTGQAVLELNREDEGNRRFILIEMEDEVCESIARVRLERVIKGHSFNGEKVKGSGGSFQYCELGSSLFNNGGMINRECTFADLAKYIYFTETKTALASRPNAYRLGEYEGTAYYLIFENVGSSKNVLDSDFLKRQIRSKDKRKVVYADKCLLDADELADNQIAFRQIPYSIRVF